MGCAGSNPLPASDTMMASATSDSRTVTADAPPMSDADKACSIVQKVVGSVNIDDVVKKIQDVGGSMENLVDETQEKFSTLFGKAEQQVEHVEEKVNDVTSTMPEKPKIQEVILLTVEETRVIPIDLIKSEILTNGNDAVFKGANNRIKEEQTEIKTEDSLIVANVKQNDKEDEVEEKKDAKKVEEETVKKETVKEQKVEEEKIEEEKVEEEKVEEKVEEEKVEEVKVEEIKVEEIKVEEVKIEGEEVEEEEVEGKKSDEELEEGEKIAEKENDEENEEKSDEVEE